MNTNEGNLCYTNRYEIARKAGEEWETISGAIMPFGGANYLDERLDEAYVTLKHSEESFIKPTTEIRITIEQIPDKDAGNETNEYCLYFIVASDEAEQCPMNYGGEKELWNHTLYLIEITKLLEGIICETITFTNASGTAYAESDWIVA